MTQDQELSFTVVNDDGESIDCEILFTFDSEDGETHYIVYTDHTLDEEGYTKVYASVYNPDTEELLAISEEEWTLVDELLQELQAEYDQEVPQE